MHKRRVVAVVVGVVLCLGAFAAAQNQPVTTQADKVITEQSGRTTLTGNVVLTVNGVVVRADRAVIQNGDVALEGNVRLTLPKPVYTSAVMRRRVATRHGTPPPLMVPPPGVKQIDTPIPPPWEPPPRNQR